MNFNTKFWQVTQEDLHTYFDGLGIVPRCSLCGHVEFSQPLVTQPMFGGSGEVIEVKNLLIPHGLPFLLDGISLSDPDSKEVVFPLTCDNCGTMLLINAKSVVPETRWPTQESTSHG
jgi:hypothetical protein